LCHFFSALPVRLNSCIVVVSTSKSKKACF
jgi:hypothetical protein